MAAIERFVQGAGMSYTVLGANGFIGGHIVHALKNAGENVYAPARDDSAVFKKNLGTVFYCIGLTNDYKDRPFDTVDAHVAYLSKLIEKADFEHLVYLSSTRLYDGADVTSENTDLKLNPVNPRHLYDLSKALGESICLTAGGRKASVARLSSVYSDDPKASGFIPDILRRLKKEKYFILDSNSGAVRDYIHIDDAVKGILYLGNRKQPGIMNVASGENVSNQEIADSVKGTGHIISFMRQTERENVHVCDISALRKAGINPVLLKTYLKDFMHAAG